MLCCYLEFWMDLSCTALLMTIFGWIYTAVLHCVIIDIEVKYLFLLSSLLLNWSCLCFPFLHFIRCPQSKAPIVARHPPTLSSHPYRTKHITQSICSLTPCHIMGLDRRFAANLLFGPRFSFMALF